MIGVHYNYNQIKSVVAVFGSLFNNIVIKRRDGKVMPVPISYGPRDKWLEAHKAFNKEEEMFEKLLPRMSYEMVSMSYDGERKLTNKQTMIRTPDSLDVPRQRVPVPVPYNIDFTLYLQTKNLNDGWQIIEQILPFFTPSYTVRVKHYPDDADKNTPVPTNAFDMPVTLNNCSWADDWTGDIGDRRMVEWTLDFSVKTHIFGPVPKTSIILDSRVIIAFPVKDSDGNVPELVEMSRATKQKGSEVGYVNLAADSDTPVYQDNSLSPNTTNLFDSDGTMVKVIRFVDNTE